MAEDVVKVAGFVRITKQMAEDIAAMKRAMAQPISQEEYEAWLAEPDENCGDFWCEACPDLPDQLDGQADG